MSNQAGGAGAMAVGAVFIGVGVFHATNGNAGAAFWLGLFGAISFLAGLRIFRRDGR